jgi:hypothetical protein
VIVYVYLFFAIIAELHEQRSQQWREQRARPARTRTANAPSAPHAPLAQPPISADGGHNSQKQLKASGTPPAPRAPRTGLRCAPGTHANVCLLDCWTLLPPPTAEQRRPAPPQQREAGRAGGTPLRCACRPGAGGRTSKAGRTRGRAGSTSQTAWGIMQVWKCGRVSGVSGRKSPSGLFSVGLC